MKTSIKVLLTISGIVMAVFIGSILILNKDLSTYLINKEGVIVYEPVAVPEFRTIDFSGPWKIRLRMGKEFNVEIGRLDSVSWELTSRQGQLMLVSDTSKGALNYARVTVPQKVALSLGEGNDFIMEDMTLDSLWITFRNGGVFTGFANQTGYLEIKTEGNVLFKINK